MSSKREPTGFGSLGGDFLDAMRRVASTVSIVTVAGPADLWLGMTATSVTSVSMEPPSLLVCLNRKGGTHDVIRQVGSFCVNVLSEDQAEQCTQFATPGPKTESFMSGDWDLRLDMPRLSGCQATIVCRVARHMVHGTHGIFIGDVEDVVIGDQRTSPLIYLNRAILPIHTSTGHQSQQRGQGPRRDDNAI